MLQDTTASDAKALDESLRSVPGPVVRPFLVVVSGLPGTGKSRFGRDLAKRVPMAILETDALRRALVGEPTYEAAESARLFKATHRLMEVLLQRGVPVLLDATNLVESHRERLYHIARRLGVRLFLVRVEAPPEVVRERLDGRREGRDSAEDHSSADWQVYQRMRPSVQRIQRDHYAVDTSRDIVPVLERLERDIRRWMRVKG